MSHPKQIDCWMTDMDGVLVHEGRMIPGADAFLARLRAKDRPFLVLTNNSIYTPRDLAVPGSATAAAPTLPVESIWTSALATASFLDDQPSRKASAYVIGEAGLTTALHEIGYIPHPHQPRTTWCSAKPTPTASRR